MHVHTTFIPPVGTIHSKGTHFLRALNHHVRGLPPAGNKPQGVIKGLALRELVTEEGLATLNTLLTGRAIAAGRERVLPRVRMRKRAS